MRIAVWNLNRRSTPSAWNALFDLQPDIALLSEVTHMPSKIDGYQKAFEWATNVKNGKEQKFMTGMLVKGEILDPFQLVSETEWVSMALKVYSGNFVCRQIYLSNYGTYNVVSVHMPHSKFPYHEFTTDDVSDVILPNYDDIYMSDLLWSALTKMVPQFQHESIVGGDFNTSEYYGKTRKQRDANLETILRMYRLGYVEAIRGLVDDMPGASIPTFKHSREKKPSKHQLDHLYLPKKSFERSSSIVGDVDTYLKFSDHLPIIADIQDG